MSRAWFQNPPLRPCVRHRAGTGVTGVVRMLNAGTGWDFTWDEAMQMGRRVVNLMRAYNIQCGLGPEVEAPGPRYGSTPTDGAAQGKSIRPVWPDMVRNFHQLMGWDLATGKPLPETLKGLGLEEVIPTLWGQNRRGEALPRPGVGPRPALADNP
ncbi:MAG: hypothetical protein HYY01_03215 [Chloroflexi bacterium]|nr:hypothetical protein [Chloroflexota bacterium]